MKNLKHKQKSTTFLKLKGKTAVFIDWANVYGWRNSLKKAISPIKLFRYLKSYKKIKQINFYYGTDNHPKSKAFLTRIKNIGFHLRTKPVKHIKINDHPPIFKRKCDFDLEICMEILLNPNKFDSYIFFSGDGDFAPLYRYLIKQKKQVIVIYAKHHLGKEVWEMKKGIFKTEINKMPVFKNHPHSKAGCS